jgi:hypothetical protein
MVTVGLKEVKKRVPGCFSTASQLLDASVHKA